MRTVLSRILALLVLLPVASALCAADSAAKPGLSPALTQIGEFSTDFLPQLQSENIITSPYLVSSAFALLSSGAAGKTKTQIDSAFHFPKDYVFPALVPPKSAGITLESTSTFFLDEHFSLHPDFISKARKDFHTAFTSIDLANPQNSADIINKVIAQATHDKITHALDAKTLRDSNTNAFVLAQTLYFKGKWKTQFDPKQTKDAAFHIPDQRDQIVPTMHVQNTYFPYAHFDGLQAVQIPYSGEKYSLLILLPDDANGFSASGNRPDLAHLKKMLGTMSSTLLDLYIPRFSISDEHDLVVPLAKLGVKDAFTARADFSGMQEKPRPLRLSFAFEQAVFAIDEQGTEAAAATVSGGFLFGDGPSPAPPKPILVRIDHPCIMIVIENETSLPLFILALTKPK